MPKGPWPRNLINFPIILFAITQQYIAGIAMLVDDSARLATSAHILHSILPSVVLPLLILGAATTAVAGFFRYRKITTLLCLIPQQLLLYLSAGGSFKAIWTGAFADGTARPIAFILVDQCPTILLAIFHSWAMLLILRYAADREY